MSDGAYHTSITTVQDSTKTCSKTILSLQLSLTSVSACRVSDCAVNTIQINLFSFVVVFCLSVLGPTATKANTHLLTVKVRNRSRGAHLKDFGTERSECGPWPSLPWK